MLKKITCILISTQGDFLFAIIGLNHIVYNILYKFITKIYKDDSNNLKWLSIKNRENTREWKKFSSPHSSKASLQRERSKTDFWVQWFIISNKPKESNSIKAQISTKENRN